ncbi:RES domain protein [Caballeronia choica]|uniref:RES domain protein n=1 Tax=Caballeronia choica TaxID=326476 RepID=A0A158KS51_9BURK|nr:RES family NAD+ phosphorylase [Caballeronia choica]SAL83420.1 RES domain protein [Caballeronia choica]
MPLKIPNVAAFSKLELCIEPVLAQSLVRVSWFDSGEPHFGKTGGNRFDDPRRSLPEEARYGTCYAGQSLECAFAETVLHNEELKRESGQYELSAQSINRFVLSFEADGPLRLANMTGAALKRLGGDGTLSTCSTHRVPQGWSKALFLHREMLDGFIYMSRHVNDSRAIVLFCRAQKKLRLVSAVPFVRHPEARAVLDAFGVRISDRLDGAG